MLNGCPSRLDPNSEPQSLTLLWMGCQRMIRGVKGRQKTVPYPRYDKNLWRCGHQASRRFMVFDTSDRRVLEDLKISPVDQNPKVVPPSARGNMVSVICCQAFRQDELVITAAPRHRLKVSVVKSPHHRLALACRSGGPHKLLGAMNVRRLGPKISPRRLMSRELAGAIQPPRLSLSGFYEGIVHGG